ncbi:MAG: porin [Aliihoeflea sp.]
MLSFSEKYPDPFLNFLTGGQNMKIKSLLLGSAAASMLAVSGAQAADPIIYAEPESMEYVRICDVYGAGFFYIPGTENCMKIGGYVRYQMNYNQRNHVPGDYSFGKLARFAPTFDVRSETELGTLRGFAEVEFDWTTGSRAADGTLIGAAQSVNLNHAFIELQNPNGVFRIGKGDTPYARFLGYGSGGIYGGVYGFNNSGEVSYTFSGGGFSGIVAAIENADGRLQPNFEAGANFSQAWGSVGGIFGYDSVASTWGAKGVVRGKVDVVDVGVHVFYSSGAGMYAISNPAGGTSTWSVMGHARAAVTPTVAVKGHVQWYQSTGISGGDSWDAVGGLVLTPVRDFQIMPEVRYTSRANAAGASNWQAAIRFQRSF